MSSDSEEWFDIVDEHDQVTGRERRSEVHRQRLRHRAIHVFVRRSDGSLLIHQRTDTKEEFPGVWTSSASGHVSSGETYTASADRELTEELGFTAPLRRCHRFAACPETSMEFTELFECRWDGEVTPDPVEIQAVRWMQPDEVADWIASEPDQFSPAFLLLFDWYHSQPQPD